MVLDIPAFHYIDNLFGYIGGQIGDTFQVMGNAHQGQSPGMMSFLPFMTSLGL